MSCDCHMIYCSSPMSFIAFDHSNQLSGIDLDTIFLHKLAALTCRINATKVTQTYSTMSHIHTYTLQS